MNKLLVTGFLLVICISKGFSQKNPAVESYILQFAPLAIEEQLRTGIPAAIKLAQAIHESAAGQGDLAMRSNNHFGIKCKSNWTGPTAYHDDDEKGECFRAYDSIAFSYRDHSDFLKNSKRYASLFELESTDYEGWAKGLKNAGYATNPKYPALLIKLIETYELFIFTDQAIAKLEKSNGQINPNNKDKDKGIGQQTKDPLN
jgi:flagellum-specific peptidoglycan hydrolase FlgJ